MSEPSPRALATPRIVKCPACGGRSAYAESNPHRPFCSERCRNNDLGAWAAEGYRVPATRQTEEGDAEEPGDPPAR